MEATTNTRSGIKTMFPIILAVAVVLGWGQPCQSASTRVPTIDNPCNTVPLASQEFPSADAQLTEIINEVHSAQESAEQLRNEVPKDNRLDASLVQYLDSSEPPQHVPQLPLRTDDDHPTLDNMVALLLKDYTDISTHIIYVKQMIVEQLNYNDNGVFVSELTQLERDFFILLCKVKTLLASEDQTVTSFVDSSDMPPETKNFSDDTNRYARAYVYAKDAKIFLENLAINYSSMLADFLLSLE